MKITTTFGILTIALIGLCATSPAAGELINDPYVLNFADGAGAVAFNLPANTGVPEIFELSYGSWSIAFEEQNLEVVLAIKPMTGTGQLQPAVSASGLDWTPIPGVITGFVRDTQSAPDLFDLTVIGIPDSVSAASTSSLGLVNAGETPSIVTWRWAIEVVHVPEPASWWLTVFALLTSVLRPPRLR